jgi:hypothetical protein
MNPIVAWLFALALHFAPPDRAHQFPGWEETNKERTARYAQIAQDVYDVVYDEDSKPIPGMSRARTAAFMLALAIGESGLDKDADQGPCYRAPGWKLRCDGGNAASMWQIMLGKGFIFDRDGKTKLYQKHLFKNRKKALEISLRLTRSSFWACRKLPPELRLAVYGGGSCANEAARKGSAKRYKLAKKLWGHKKIPKHTPKKKTAKKKSGSAPRAAAPNP